MQLLRPPRHLSIYSGESSRSQTDSALSVPLYKCRGDTRTLLLLPGSRRSQISASHLTFMICAGRLQYQATSLKVMTSAWASRRQACLPAEAAHMNAGFPSSPGACRAPKSPSFAAEYTTTPCLHPCPLVQFCWRQLGQAKQEGQWLSSFPR